MTSTNLSDFAETSFTYENKTRVVYRKGTGPGVIIIHEIPGITPKVADFGRRVAEQGFTVFLPSLFGTPGKEMSNAYAAEQIVRACISGEFYVLSLGKSSPITNWLRALCRHAHAELGGPGVGALGMCLTGNFALSLMVDPVVMAPVLSQPSLPFGITKTRRQALHLSEAELSQVKDRTQNGVCILGLRFTNDFMVPPERFEMLRQQFGSQFEGIEIDSSPGNPFNIPRSAHSVLTEDLVDEAGHPTKQALDRVFTFFKEQLLRE